MVAILDRSGAYLYNCPAEEFARRLSEKAASGKDTLHYTAEGKYRKDRDGLIGWLLPTSGLIKDIERFGCEAAFINIGKEEYRCIEKSGFMCLDEVYRSVLYSQKSETE